MTQAQKQRTAGVVVIGNEVLSAKIRDANTPVLLEKLAAAGVRVCEVAVLPDDVARIAAVVRDFAKRFDVVLTTGGVGPTHDDCTWQAVGRALDRPLALHAELVARIEQRTGVPLTEEQKRLAVLPEGTQLVGLEARFPTFQVDNVFVLPGVPSMVVPRVDALCASWNAPRPHLSNVYFTIDEWHAVAAIDALVAAFPDLEIGSYPIFHDADHRLRLTLEGFDRDRVAQAVEFITERIGAEFRVRVQWREDSH